MTNVGRVIYGFCNGFFGRDDYDNKRIEAEGVDWIGGRAVDPSIGESYARFACFENEKEKEEYIKEWSVEVTD